MANEQNLKPCRKGETHNPNGRPKKLKNILKGLPADVQEKVYSVLAYVLTLKDEEEAKRYLECKSGELGDYGFVLQLCIKKLIRDSDGWYALMDIMDRLYGRPRETKELQTKGEGLTIVVKSADQREKLENLSNLEI